jgi:hypothetical protein
VIAAEMDEGSHLLQRRTAFEIFHDVFDDGAEVRQIPTGLIDDCEGKYSEVVLRIVRDCMRRLGAR